MRKVRKARRDRDSVGDSFVGQTPAQMGAAFATSLIRQKKVLFDTSGNPVHAVAAFRLARRGGVPIPEWVLEHYDQKSKKLLSAASVKDVASAVGWHSGGGPFFTERAKTEERNLGIWRQVDDLKHCDPETLSPELREELRLDGAFAVVGRRKNLSPESVEDIYYDVMKRFLDQS